MKKEIIVIFTVFFLGVSLALAAPTNRTEPLSEETLKQSIGEGCDSATGVMTAAAFAAGYTSVINPALSAGFLAAAGTIGLGIVLWC